MSLDNLKLNKQLLSAMEEAGYSSSKELQEKTLSRIIGGHDIIGVGPEGCGKTSTLVLGVLMRLKYTQDEPPRALILVPDKERVLTLMEHFQFLGKHTDIKTMGLYAGVGMEGQKEALAEGVDVVIGTPDRIHAIYLKSGLNINKIKMFILDDAELIVRQGFQTIVHELADRLPKCQHLIFSEVFHTKLDLLINPFMNFPTLIEVSEFPETPLETIDQVLYEVPNYKTKLNLLNMLMTESEVYSKEAYAKIVVFANTNITAESVYKNLNKRIAGEAALLKAKDKVSLSVDSIEDFLNAPELRVLVIANEQGESPSLKDIPLLIHFDIPEAKELLVDRIQKQETTLSSKKLAITFATDIELSLVRKIEQAIGKKIPVELLPPGLIIEGDRQSQKEEQDAKIAITSSKKGSAFAEKKASNAKTHNYKYHDRLKMFGKKNRKDKRGE